MAQTAEERRLKHLAHSNRVYKERKAQGLCTVGGCPNMAKGRGVRCYTHSSLNADYNRLNRRNPTPAHRKAYVKSIRQEVIAAYGNKCACCGESGFPFLTMDHKLGKGNEHRRKTFGTSNCSIQFYLWLRRNKFPDDFQVLCYNCNMAKRGGPECPHVAMRAAEEEKEGMR